MPTSERCADPSVREFFGLRFDPDSRTGHFTVLDRMSNPRGTLYGGAGVAVAAAAMEAATNRRLLWITAQFSDTGSRGDDLECTVEVLAAGHRTSQLRATITRKDTLVLTAMGAVGEARDDAAAVTFDRMPVVRAPSESPTLVLEVEGDMDRSRFATIEHRVAAEPSTLLGTGTHVAWWCRVDGLRSSPPALAYVSDLLVFGVAEALGQPLGRATSLDNSVRVGTAADTDWMLLDLRAQSTSDGFAHGLVNIWTPGGVLLATASQTLALRSAAGGGR